MTMNAGMAQAQYVTPPGYMPPGQPCPQCGVPSAGNRSCANCRQVYGMPLGVKLANPGRRLGATLLSGLLGFVTLYIGWLIWDIVLNSKGSGQSPGKQLLKIRVIDLDTGRPATFGKMFLRGLVKQICFSIGGSVGIGLIVALYLLIDKDNQELWDKAGSTVVIADPNNMYAPDNLPPAVVFVPQPMAAPVGASYQAPPPSGAPYQPGSYQSGPAQPPPEAGPPPGAAPPGPPPS